MASHYGKADQKYAKLSAKAARLSFRNARERECFFIQLEETAFRLKVVVRIERRFRRVLHKIFSEVVAATDTTKRIEKQLAEKVSTTGALQSTNAWTAVQRQAGGDDDDTQQFCPLPDVSWILAIRQSHSASTVVSLLRHRLDSLEDTLAHVTKKQKKGDRKISQLGLDARAFRAKKVLLLEEEVRYRSFLYQQAVANFSLLFRLGTPLFRRFANQRSSAAHLPPSGRWPHHGSTKDAPAVNDDDEGPPPVDDRSPAEQGEQRCAAVEAAELVGSKERLENGRVGMEHLRSRRCGEAQRLENCRNSAIVSQKPRGAATRIPRSKAMSGTDQIFWKQMERINLDVGSDRSLCQLLDDICRSSEEDETAPFTVERNVAHLSPSRAPTTTSPVEERLSNAGDDRNSQRQGGKKNQKVRSPRVEAHQSATQEGTQPRRHFTTDGPAEGHSFAEQYQDQPLRQDSQAGGATSIVGWAEEVPKKPRRCRTKRKTSHDGALCKPVTPAEHEQFALPLPLPRSAQNDFLGQPQGTACPNGRFVVPLPRSWELQPWMEHYAVQCNGRGDSFQRELSGQPNAVSDYHRLTHCMTGDSRKQNEPFRRAVTHRRRGKKHDLPR